MKRILKQEAKRRREGESVLEREGIKPPTPRGSKLDPYDEQITAWLERFPKLTSRRVWEMLQDLGVEVGYSIVRMRVKELRQTKKSKEAVVKVVTPPGHQFQFDWSPYTIADGSTVQLFGCILSWARGHSFEGSDNTRQTTVLRFLQASFDSWGGVPHQGVTDSMPGVVDRWELDEPVLNIRFVDFAAYYDFAVLISPRAMPRFKGKVERPFLFAELNLLNGREFHSLQQFQETLVWWTRERALKLPHPDTGQPRWRMVEEERPYLQPLPAHPYDTRDVLVPVVDAYGFATCLTNRYRLPDKYIGERVYACIGVDHIEFFDRTVHRINDYERLPDGAGLEVGGGKRKARHDIGLLADRLATWGDEATLFAARLSEQQRCSGAHMAHLLGLQVQWSLDDIVAAIRHALDYQAYDAKAIERILDARFLPRRLDEQIGDATRKQVRTMMAAHPVVQRSLDQYETLKQGDPSPDNQEDAHEPKKT